MSEELLMNGQKITKECNPVAYNTLMNMFNYLLLHKVDKKDFSNPRVRMYYAVDKDLNVHCSPNKDNAESHLNNMEDTVKMNISTFNKIQELIK